MPAEVHRGLHLTTPLTKGDDVKALQYAVNQINDDKGGFWGVGRDGVYGQHTAHSAYLSAWAIGIGDDDTRDLRKRGHATKGLQLWLRHPETRNDAQKARAESLKDEVARRIARHGAGADAAIKWALSQVGVTEMPAGSNWGHPVQDWIERTGYTSPVPWCGCFAREAIVSHGKAKVFASSRFGYSGYIDADARSGSNGLHLVATSQAQKGDLGTLSFDGNGSDHVVVVVAKPSGGYVKTVEGNTSPSTSGSQFNGGCVAVKSRAESLFVTVARPDY